MRIPIDPARAAEYPPSIQNVLKRRAPAAAALGQQLLEYDPQIGWMRIGYGLGEEHVNLFGAIHGWVVAALMDDALAITAGLRLDVGQINPTLEMKVTYLHMARPGRLYVEAQFLRRGAQVTFMEARLTNEEGKLLAVASSTHMVADLRS